MFMSDFSISGFEDMLEGSLTSIGIAGLFTLIIGLWLIHLASKNAGSGRTCWGWILVIIIMCIPIVDIIMLFVWAFGSKTSDDTSFKCWARLILIAMAMGIIFVVAFYLLGMFLVV